MYGIISCNICFDVFYLKAPGLVESVVLHYQIKTVECSKVSVCLVGLQISGEEGEIGGGTQ